MQRLYFLRFFISTNRMTLQTSQARPFMYHIFWRLSLEMNLDHFGYTRVTVESASHPKLGLTSRPEREIWTTLILAKYTDLVSQLSPALCQGTPLLCCHSPFSCLENVLAWGPTPWPPQFRKCRRHPLCPYSARIEFASAKNLSQCFRRLNKPFGKIVAS